MKRKRRAGGNPNRRLEITNGISGWCGANTSRQVCDFSRSDTKARLHVPGGLIGQLLYQWEGVIQLSQCRSSTLWNDWSVYLHDAK